MVADDRPERTRGMLGVCIGENRGSQRSAGLEGFGTQGRAAVLVPEGQTSGQWRALALDAGRAMAIQRQVTETTYGWSCATLTCAPDEEKFMGTIVKLFGENTGSPYEDAVEIDDEHVLAAEQETTRRERVEEAEQRARRTQFWNN